LRYVLIECGVKCPKCDNPVPLNGPWESAHCDHCQADFDVPRDYWTDIFKDILGEIKEGELGEGEGRNSTIWGTFNTTLMYGNQIPYCLGCGTDFPEASLKPDAGTLACAKCGETVETALPPAWLAEFRPRLLVGASVSGADEPQPEGVPGPVAFTCPKCGGALVVDGSDRLVPCQFCDVKVYLPDDLWLRLHPAKSKSRWFVVFD
jgi:hypothetical protein